MSATRSLAALVTLLIALVPCLASAQSPASRAGGASGLDLDSVAWDGLSTLQELARRRGASLTQPTSVDLDGPATRRDTDALWLVHPTRLPPVAGLLDWVSEGHVLVVADDFGGSEPLLEALGLTRIAVPPETPRYLGLEFAPLATPGGRHPLTNGVDALVTNHPSAFGSPLTGALAFTRGAGAVFDFTVGRGLVIAISDPSVFTNLMLGVPANARFADNLVARACRGAAPCQMALLSDDAELHARAAESGPLRWLLQLRRMRPDPKALRLASLLLVIGIWALVGAVYPTRPPGWVIAPTRLAAARSLTELEYHLRRHASATPVPDATAPATLLARALERDVYPRLGVPPATQVPDGVRRAEVAAELYLARFEPRASGRRRRGVAAALTLLARLVDGGRRPATVHGARPAAREWVSRRSLVDLVAVDAAIRAATGASPEKR
ncbi:MAG: DUF4350 domain-containing protein [Myxococcales bacterium]|nr:DUF4350 domain-containing protein [Myxococcales bacterium]MCB9519999.1 DUF4350 domain-containing protein [Myxococcales bacterium]MCB9534358.1 DUF4350 domain-containing protein [Myxococcales bacterium]